MDHHLTLAREAVRDAASDPTKALSIVAALAGGPRPPPTAGLVALAEALAYRSLGQTSRVRPGLESAIALLRDTPERDARGRARAALAFEHANAGRFELALAELDLASPDLRGVDRARLGAQRSLILQRAGQVNDAVAGWNTAVRAFRRFGAPVDEANALQIRGLVRAYRGELDRAAEDLAAAATLFVATGQPLQLAELEHNRGFVAARRGDLPSALLSFDTAQRTMHELGVVRVPMMLDRGDALLAAGLPAEAGEIAEAAVAHLRSLGLDTDLGEACLLAARAAIDAGDAVRAADWASEAQAIFAAQGRSRWAALAAYHLLRAQPGGGPESGREADAAQGSGQSGATTGAAFEAASGALGEAGWGSAALGAGCEAVHRYVREGEAEAARRALARVTARRRGAAPLERLAIDGAEAAYRVLRAETDRAWECLDAGLAALRQHQAGLGSTELRSRAVERADVLVALGLHLAVTAGDGWHALRWMEVVRSALLPGAAGRPGRLTAETAAVLERLRDVTARIEREPTNARTATALRRERAALEELLRRSDHHSPARRPARRPARAEPGRGDPDIEHLVRLLDGRALIEYAVVEHRVVGVVLDAETCRAVDVGSVGDVRQAVATLRQAAIGATIAEGVAATTTTAASDLSMVGSPAGAQRTADAARAASALLVDPLEIKDAARVVLVPAGPLASVPWGLLPAFAGTELAIVPSVRRWERSMARLGRLPRRPRVLAVAGPGLRFAGREVRRVATTWGEGTQVLTGPAATVAAVVAGIARADVVHLAAHGTFRSDNPLVSSIRLADGVLTGYALERLPRCPPVLVFSCCDLGMTTADGTGAFGLAGLMLSVGCASAIASVTSVDDRASARFMPGLHDTLRATRSPAGALAALRRGARRTAPASLGGLVCFGA